MQLCFGSSQGKSCDNHYYPFSKCAHLSCIKDSSDSLVDRKMDMYFNRILQKKKCMLWSGKYINYMHEKVYVSNYWCNAKCHTILWLYCMFVFFKHCFLVKNCKINLVVRCGVHCLFILVLVQSVIVMNGWIKVVVVMFCFTFDMKIMNFLLKLYI